ncbi:MAG TPA: twin transmembrane helix small protein, partial [Burkholderiaceae bacterium]|nr:twin transmembrane helix small protein [Burkholderiaceae bacterium]
MKYLIGLAFVGILGALALAGVFMLRDGRDGETKRGNMMRALAVRVGLSVLLFACVLFSWWAGWIQPTGIPL